MKKRKNLVLIGAGKSIYEIVPIIKESEENFNLKAIYDDNKIYKKKKIFGIPVTYGIENAKKEKNSYFVFGIGSFKNRRQRKKIFDRISIKKELFPNIIDRTVKILEKVNIGYGNIIYPYSVICSESRIKNFCHLTYSTIIAHNVNIGSFVTIGSRSTILNNAIIGNNTFLGSNVMIAENLKIGSNVTLIFSSNIISNCENGKTYFGNPAKKIY